MAEEKEKRGTIRTMDDDLSRAHSGTNFDTPQEATKKSKPQKESAPPTPPSAPPKPQMSDKELDELLPLEDAPTDATRLSEDMSPASESVVRSLPQEDPPKPAPAPSSRKLEREIFPEPEIKKDFTDIPAPKAPAGMPPSDLPTGGDKSLPTPPPPPPTTRVPTPEGDRGPDQSVGKKSNEETPTETPEEILGISDDGRETEPPQPSPPAAEAPPSVPSDSRRVMLMGIATLVIIALATGGAYYWFFLQDEPAPPPDNTDNGSQVQEITPPEPLVAYDFQQIITVANFQSGTIFSTLATLSARTYRTGSITYLPIRNSTEGQGVFIGATTFLAALNIPTPSTLPDIVEERFMLYVYGAGIEEQALCDANGITSTSCWGPRLGIVLQAREGRSGDLTALSAQWRAVGEEGLKSLILSTPQTSPSTDYQQEEYIASTGSVPVHYKNFPISTTTLDFAVMGDLLVIATSKNALFTLLTAANVAMPES